MQQSAPEHSDHRSKNQQGMGEKPAQLTGETNAAVACSKTATATGPKGKNWTKPQGKKLDFGPKVDQIKPISS